MAGTVPVPSSEPINIGILSAQIMKEAVDKFFFDRWTFGQGAKGTANKMSNVRIAKGEMVAPVSPIVKLTDFQKPMGMERMYLPCRKPLVGDAYYGDAIITGKGEKQRWDLIPVFINDIAFPLEGPAFMSNQRVKVLNLANASRPDLSLRLAQELEIQCVSAIHEGLSRNITAGVADYGLGKAKHYHPNFYTAGQGKATWNGTVQTHANNIGADVDALGDVSSHHFNVLNLERLQGSLEDDRIDPIMVDGMPYYVVLAHPYQLTQLRLDTRYRDEMSRADNRGSKNRLVTEAECKIANLLIYKRRLSCFGLSVSETGGNYTLTFGAASPVSAVDTFPVKVATVFGNNFLSQGVASGVRFGEADQNIQGYKEYAIRQATAFARNTAYDVDPSESTPTRATDNGSATFATYSAAPWES